MNFLKKLTPQDMLRQDLNEARDTLRRSEIDRLRAISALEWADSQASLAQARIKRLEAAIGAADRGIPATGSVVLA
jgi:hypothetical protein